MASKEPKASSIADHKSRIAFLDDAPAPADDFDGGAHRRVAEALVDTIRSGSGGRAIGLEGTWGSGKSTVIEIARSLLEQNQSADPNRYCVFSFDAWAHQGDPMRRIFLEEIIEWLSSSKIIQADDWHHYLERIRGRIKTTESKSTPRLTPFAKFIALWTPFVPLAYLWLSPFALKDISIYSISSTIALAILAAPYFAMFFMWAYRRTPRLRAILPDKLANISGDQSIVALFARSTDEVVTEQLIRDEEPTTLEFNDIFDRVAASVASENVQLVIVLDNLDRLPSDMIREIWATMRNFFTAARGSSREDTLKHVWLVVPFDRHHMEEVFAQNGQAGESGLPTRGFIEKTFQVILRISPPLLSHWRKYLDQQLEAAFGDRFGTEQRYSLFRLLELNLARDGLPVTPRAIKAFVNGLAVQWIQWKDEIPVEYQALYILNRDRIEADVDRLKTSTLLDERTAIYLGDREWTKYVAAAYFNVGPEQAMEVLLGQDIEAALIGRHVERLRVLQATTGFELALHKVVEDRAASWTRAEPVTFARVCGTLSAFELEDDAIRREIWRSLSTAGDAFGELKSFDDEVIKGLSTLIRHAEAGGATRLARTVLRSLTSAEKDGLDDPAGWVRLIDEMAGGVREVAGAEEVERIFPEISIPGDVNFVVKVAEACGGARFLSFGWFRPQTKPEDIGTAFSNAIREPEPKDSLRQLNSSLLQRPQDCRWPDVISAIRSRLRENQPELQPDAMFLLLGIMLEVRRHDVVDVDKGLTELLADGTLLGILGVARHNKHIQLAGATLWIIITLCGHKPIPGQPQHPRYGQVQNQLTFYDQLRASPEEEGDIVSELIAYAGTEHKFSEVAGLAIAKKPGHELFGAILRGMVHKRLVRRLHIERVLTEYDQIAEVLGDDLEREFLVIFDGWASYVPKTLVNDGVLNLSSRFLRHTAKYGTNAGQKSRQAASEYLQRLNQQAWEQALSKETSAVRVLVDLVHTGPNPTLPEQFHRALWLHADGVISRDMYPKKFVQDWHSLPMTLRPNSRRTFYRNLLTALVGRVPSPERIRNVLRLYGPEFPTSAGLSKRPNEIVRTVLCPLLGEANEEGLEWIEANSGALGACIKKANREERDYLETTIEDILGRDGVEKGRISTISNALGLGSALKSRTAQETGGGAR